MANQKENDLNRKIRDNDTSVDSIQKDLEFIKTHWDIQSPSQIPISDTSKKSKIFSKLYSCIKLCLGKPVETVPDRQTRLNVHIAQLFDQIGLLIAQKNKEIVSINDSLKKIEGQLNLLKIERNQDLEKVVEQLRKFDGQLSQQTIISNKIEEQLNLLKIERNRDLENIPEQLRKFDDQLSQQTLTSNKIEEQLNLLKIERNQDLENILGQLRKFDSQLSQQTLTSNKIDARLKPQILMAVDPNSISISEKFDYFDFENVFRGSEDLIKQRQRNYLVFFQGKEKIVDLGCGRGEFLELLKEQDLTGIGIDTDSEMIKKCTDKGLQVIQKDVINYLQDLPDNTIEGIFSAQVIEHLEFENLDRFFRLSYQKLKPNGVLVVETVNPYNLSAFRCFYLDPSHKKPLFPEFISYLCRSSGFRESYVNYFWPNSHNSDDPESQWNAGDYAIIAKK